MVYVATVREGWLRREIFPMQDYPMYMIEKILHCEAQALRRMVSKHHVLVFKRNGTTFITQDELIRLCLRNDPCVQKHLPECP